LPARIPGGPEKGNTMERKDVMKRAEDLGIEVNKFWSTEKIQKMIAELDSSIKTAQEKIEKVEPNSYDAKNAIDFAFKEGILFKIDSKCWWGKSNRVSEDELKIDKTIMEGVKILIDPKHLSSLKSARSHGERILKSRSYPFLGLRGVYYVPKDLIGNTESRMKKYQDEFRAEIDDFIDNYESYIKEWEVELGEEHFDAKLYPTKEELRSRFKFDWIKFSITVPDSTMGILTEEEYQEEVKKQSATVKEFLDNSLSILSGKFYNIILNLSEKLGSGKPIKPATIKTLTSFVEIFDTMNVTNNAELASLVKTATEAMRTSSGADSKEIAVEINDNAGIKKKIKSGISKVAKAFEKEAEKCDEFKRAIEF
jgi:hypothetical protein